MTSYLSGLLTRDPTASFAYEVGERIPGLDAAQSIWTIHEGKLKKAPHTKVSVFNYDPKTGSDVTTEVAKNCLKRIKTLRHPNIVTYIGNSVRNRASSSVFFKIAWNPKKRSTSLQSL